MNRQELMSKVFAELQRRREERGETDKPAESQQDWFKKFVEEKSTAGRWGTLPNDYWKEQK